MLSGQHLSTAGQMRGWIAEAVWLELWELGRPWTVWAVGLWEAGEVGRGGCMWLVPVWPVALDSFRATFKFLID